MKEVFVSYKVMDRPFAEKIVEYLESHGIYCYIAPRDVRGGIDYARDLVKALDESKVFLLVASEKINNADHVLNEINIVTDKNVTILPIFIEDFELSDELRYYLGRKHRIMAVEGAFDSHLPHIHSAVAELLPKRKEVVVEEEEADKKPKNTKTIFEYIPDRGIMINPEDHQRNVSFRTDTLINMMGGIYDKVSAITADPAVSEEIFFSSGFVSGKNFAERINSQWDTGNTIDDIRRKLKKWCEFDSAVGWGKFSVDIEYDEEDDRLEGTLRINEAFLVDKLHKRKVCSFIRGYCTGVMETLLDEWQVKLTCKACPLKSHFKNTCEFEITAKED